MPTRQDNQQRSFMNTPLPELAGWLWGEDDKPKQIEQNFRRNYPGMIPNIIGPNESTGDVSVTDRHQPAPRWGIENIDMILNRDRPEPEPTQDRGSDGPNPNFEQRARVLLDPENIPKPNYETADSAETINRLREMMGMERESYDLQPLMALSDQWFGGNLASQYQDPYDQRMAEASQDAELLQAIDQLQNRDRESRNTATQLEQQARSGYIDQLLEQQDQISDDNYRDLRLQLMQQRNMINAQGGGGRGGDFTPTQVESWFYDNLDPMKPGNEPNIVRYKAIKRDVIEAERNRLEAEYQANPDLFEQTYETDDPSDVIDPAAIERELQAELSSKMLRKARNNKGKSRQRYFLEATDDLMSEYGLGK